ncbi:unnamed protein product [Vitrella brassicaformis CCMP3155]|uniref:Uncharacterized protein n=1 Tax=Vitrella brassicaformis (strain CCMP3155) TaxID=1169540 RepID=A0A0G4F2F9_VITBC|nr:unnamed protein product [Vitrella brassicaformis CCMP3155]|eukprot:CEM05729.1 unnamed protein product [Vitrella brassicaformis CCMP3155]
MVEGRRKKPKSWARVVDGESSGDEFDDAGDDTPVPAAAAGAPLGRDGTAQLSKTDESGVHTFWAVFPATCISEECRVYLHSDAFGWQLSAANKMERVQGVKPDHIFFYLKCRIEQPHINCKLAVAVPPRHELIYEKGDASTWSPTHDRWIDFSYLQNKYGIVASRQHVLYVKDHLVQGFWQTPMKMIRDFFTPGARDPQVHLLPRGSWAWRNTSSLVYLMPPMLKKLAREGRVDILEWKALIQAASVAMQTARIKYIDSEYLTIIREVLQLGTSVHPMFAFDPDCIDSRRPLAVSAASELIAGLRRSFHLIPHLAASRDARQIAAEWMDKFLQLLKPSHHALRNSKDESELMGYILVSLFRAQLVGESVSHTQLLGQCQDVDVMRYVLKELIELCFTDGRLDVEKATTILLLVPMRECLKDAIDLVLDSPFRNASLVCKGLVHRLRAYPTHASHEEGSKLLHFLRIVLDAVHQHVAFFFEDPTCVVSVIDLLEEIMKAPAFAVEMALKHKRSDLIISKFAAIFALPEAHRASELPKMGPVLQLLRQRIRRYLDSVQADRQKAAFEIYRDVLAALSNLWDEQSSDSVLSQLVAEVVNNLPKSFFVNSNIMETPLVQLLPQLPQNLQQILNKQALEVFGAAAIDESSQLQFFEKIHKTLKRMDVSRYQPAQLQYLVDCTTALLRQLEESTKLPPSTAQSSVPLEVVRMVDKAALYRFLSRFEADVVASNLTAAIPQLRTIVTSLQRSFLAPYRDLLHQLGNGDVYKATLDFIYRHQEAFAAIAGQDSEREAIVKAIDDLMRKKRAIEDKEGTCEAFLTQCCTDDGPLGVYRESCRTRLHEHAALRDESVGLKNWRAFALVERDETLQAMGFAASAVSSPLCYKLMLDSTKLAPCGPPTTVFDPAAFSQLVEASVTKFQEQLQSAYGLLVSPRALNAECWPLVQPVMALLPSSRPPAAHETPSQARERAHQDREIRQAELHRILTQEVAHLQQLMRQIGIPAQRLSGDADLVSSTERWIIAWETVPKVEALLALIKEHEMSRFPFASSSQDMQRLRELATEVAGATTKQQLEERVSDMTRICPSLSHVSLDQLKGLHGAIKSSLLRRILYHTDDASFSTFFEMRLSHASDPLDVDLLQSFRRLRHELFPYLSSADATLEEFLHTCSMLSAFDMELYTSHAARITHMLSAAAQFEGVTALETLCHLYNFGSFNIRVIDNASDATLIASYKLPAGTCNELSYEDLTELRNQISLQDLPTSQDDDNEEPAAAATTASGEELLTVSSLLHNRDKKTAYVKAFAANLESSVRIRDLLTGLCRDGHLRYQEGVLPIRVSCEVDEFRREREALEDE